MKLDGKLVGLAIGAVAIVPGIAQSYGNDNTISSLRSYFASSTITADPSEMVIVGIALIALRVLVARRSKREE
jgi:hypothetical protein